MSLDQFVQYFNLKPGDAVVVKKDSFKLLDHYLIYLGCYFGEHKFIANYTRGTRILSSNELSDFSSEFSASRIRRFKGNDVQRNAAVQRALSRHDQDSYHLILNNCEHYANYVQHSQSYSNQSAVFGVGIAVTGFAIAATSKSNATKGVGTAMAVLGLITLMLNDND